MYCLVSLHQWYGLRQVISAGDCVLNFLLAYFYLSHSTPISMITMEEKSSAPHEVRINNGGNNIDFNVEDNSGNVYFTADASTSRIGIGTETPSEKLTITDTLKKLISQ